MVRAERGATVPFKARGSNAVRERARVRKKSAGARAGGGADAVEDLARGLLLRGRFALAFSLVVDGAEGAARRGLAGGLLRRVALLAARGRVPLRARERHGEVVSAVGHAVAVTAVRVTSCGGSHRSQQDDDGATNDDGHSMRI